MADKIFEDMDKIQEILGMASRLKTVLKEKYKILPQDISSLKIDGDNFKIDISTKKGAMIRIKAKGTDTVLASNPDNGTMVMQQDPALAQCLFRISDEFT